MPVSCYICGRDFGTKSITIHIPNCIKKWENEQKKLPKSQRRPPPSAPVNLDKVISGELRGEELNKFNGEVLQEWNDTALVPCEHCGRTFLPSSLERHQKSCTADNPMVKKSSKDESYTSRAGAKVSYPKLKPKEKSTKGHEDETNGQDDESTNPSKDDLISLIQSSEILSKGKLRSDLFKLIDDFLKENKN